MSFRKHNYIPDSNPPPFQTTPPTEELKNVISNCSHPIGNQGQLEWMSSGHLCDEFLLSRFRALTSVWKISQTSNISPATISLPNTYMCIIGERLLRQAKASTKGRQPSERRKSPNIYLAIQRSPSMSAGPPLGMLVPPTRTTHCNWHERSSQFCLPKKKSLLLSFVCKMTKTPTNCGTRRDTLGRHLYSRPEITAKLLISFPVRKTLYEDKDIPVCLLVNFQVPEFGTF